MKKRNKHIYIYVCIYNHINTLMVSIMGMGGPIWPPMLTTTHPTVENKCITMLPSNSKIMKQI